MSKTGIMGLLTEIDCRIEHGSNDNGHLNYVRYSLEKILYGENARERDLEKETDDRYIGLAVVSDDGKDLF